jgi:hypothetical protein
VEVLANLDVPGSSSNAPIVGPINSTFDVDL